MTEQDSMVSTAATMSSVSLEDRVPYRPAPVRSLCVGSLRDPAALSRLQAPVAFYTSCGMTQDLPQGIAVLGRSVAIRTIP